MGKPTVSDRRVRAASGRALGFPLALLLAAFLALAAASGPRSHAFIYWANSGGQTIGRANLNGTGVNQRFIRGASVPCAVAVDGAHLYWGDESLGTTIGRANLNGTGVNRSFIKGASPGGSCGVAVDGAHIYWANNNFKSGTTIGRANLDGTGVNQRFIRGAKSPCGVAVDGDRKSVV